MEPALLVPLFCLLIELSDMAGDRAVAQFTVSGFRQSTMADGANSPSDLKEMAETLADISLMGF